MIIKLRGGQARSVEELQLQITGLVVPFRTFWSKEKRALTGVLTGVTTGVLVAIVS